MQQPEKVLAEVHRVLKPGGWVVITFSNRQFYTKVGGCAATPREGLDHVAPCAGALMLGHGTAAKHTCHRSTSYGMQWAARPAACR